MFQSHFKTAVYDSKKNNCHESVCNKVQNRIWKRKYIAHNDRSCFCVLRNICNLISFIFWSPIKNSQPKLYGQEHQPYIQFTLFSSFIHGVQWLRCFASHVWRRRTPKKNETKKANGNNKTIKKNSFSDDIFWVAFNRSIIAAQN